MTLEDGLYRIHSHLTNDAVGHRVVEDRSLLPKAIHVLPKGLMEIPKVNSHSPPQNAGADCESDLVYNREDGEGTLHQGFRRTYGCFE